MMFGSELPILCNFYLMGIDSWIFIFYFKFLIQSSLFSDKQPNKKLLTHIECKESFHKNLIVSLQCTEVDCLILSFQNLLWLCSAAIPSLSSMPLKKSINLMYKLIYVCLKTQPCYWVATFSVFFNRWNSKSCLKSQFYLTSILSLHIKWTYLP